MDAPFISIFYNCNCRTYHGLVEANDEQLGGSCITSLPLTIQSPALGAMHTASSVELYLILSLILEPIMLSMLLADFPKSTGRMSTGQASRWQISLLN